MFFKDTFYIYTFGKLNKCRKWKMLNILHRIFSQGFLLKKCLVPDFFRSFISKNLSFDFFENFLIFHILFEIKNSKEEKSLKNQ